MSLRNIIVYRLFLISPDIFISNKAYLFEIKVTLTVPFTLSNH